MRYIWSEEKNTIIKSQPGRNEVGFEEIEKAIHNGNVIFDDDNDTVRYPNQKAMIVIIYLYPYKVPYEQIDPNTRKLITAYPYRKFKKFNI